MSIHHFKNYIDNLFDRRISSDAYKKLQKKWNGPYQNDNTVLNVPQRAIGMILKIIIGNVTKHADKEKDVVFEFTLEPELDYYRFTISICDYREKQNDHVSESVSKLETTYGLGIILPDILLINFPGKHGNMTDESPDGKWHQKLWVRIQKADAEDSYIKVK